MLDFIDQTSEGSQLIVLQVQLVQVSQTPQRHAHQPVVLEVELGEAATTGEEIDVPQLKWAR